jgi:calcineurin-like phosphoesterase family protein
MEMNTVNTFMTSDLHFRHNKKEIYGPRGFESIEEHDDTIVKNWNETVGKDDIVYVLGDVAMGTDEEEIIKKISSLNGTLYILLGNHDTTNKCKIYEKCPNVVIHQNVYTDIIKSGKWSFYLSHCPTIVTGNILISGKEPRRICLHGHTHSKDRFEHIQYACYNIALDAHDNRPVNIEDIKNEVRDKIQAMRRELKKE